MDLGVVLPGRRRRLGAARDAAGEVDAAHVRNALARLEQTNISTEAKASAHRKLAAAAKQVKVQVGKADMVPPVEILTTLAEDQQQGIPEMDAVDEECQAYCAQCGNACPYCAGQITSEAMAKHDAEVLPPLRLRRQREGRGLPPPRSARRPGDLPPRPILRKLDLDRQIIYGVALDPYIVDALDDWTPPREVEDTAHAWLRKSRAVHVDHGGKADAVPVESFLLPYPSPDDYHAAMSQQPHRIYAWHLGEDVVHSGAWILATQVDDPLLWGRVLKEELGAYSIGGVGDRTPLDDEMPHQAQVTEVLHI